MKLLLILVMAQVIIFDLCDCSVWDHKHGQGPRPPPHMMPRMSRDRPRPPRHHRHIQAHNNFHRPHPRMQRPMPPPGHRRRSRPPPPPRHMPVKAYRSPNNQGSMLLQPVNHVPINPPRNQHPPPQHFERPPPHHFQQDEIINEQSKHFPVTVPANGPPRPSPPRQSIPAESQTHGYLSSTYKGWKPIVKPYQDSYFRPPKTNGKTDYPRKQEFNNVHSSPSPNSIHPASSNSMHQNLNLNTLFRENTDHMKPANAVGNAKLKSDYSQNQGVSVSLPSEVGARVHLPPSIFMDSPWNNKYNGGGMAVSQSEEVPIIKKPFPKFQPKLKNAGSNPSSASPPANENSENDQKIPKFKFNRPRPRPPLKDSSQGNEPQQGGIQKSPPPPFTQQSEEVSSAQIPLNLKAKLSSRGRVRVRTKVVRPGQFSQSEEESLPPPKSLQPFENQRTQRIPLDRPQNANDNEQRQPGPPYHPPSPPPPPRRAPQERPNFEQIAAESPPERPYQPPPTQRPPPPPPQPPPQRNVGRPHDSNRGVNNSPRNRTESTYFQPQAGPDHSNRAPHHNPTFYERPVQDDRYTQGHQETTESDLKYNDGGQKQQGGRRKRPKGGHKSKPIEQHEPTVFSQSQSPVLDFHNDFHFPPGFNPDPSKNAGQHPVSFMTMPGGKPQVIHHETNYNSQHPQTQQQLYPINVMRAPASDLEYQRPSHGHGTNPNGNYVQNNRPRFVIMNVQNGASQTHTDDSGFHNQHNQAAVHPSNHESTYSPHAFGSNIAPYTYGAPYPPSRHPMTFSSPSPAAEHYIPPRVSPIQSSTMRNPYFQSSNAHSFSVPYEGSPTMNSYEVRGSSEANPFLSSPGYIQPTSPSYIQPTSPGYIQSNSQNYIQPTSPGYLPPTSPASYPQMPSTSPRTVHSAHPTAQQRPQGHQRQHYPEYAAASFNSEEYDKIPMEFADQLRPILRDEQLSSPSTTPRDRHTHQSPEIHPPDTFFDDFFKPFDDSYSRPPMQDLDTKSSSTSHNQFNHPTYVHNDNMGFDTYKSSQSSPQAHVVPHPVRGSVSYKQTTSASAPVSYSSRGNEIENPPSGPSTNSYQYDDINSHSPKTWSKPRENEHQASSTETAIHTTTAHQNHKKAPTKVNQSKQQSTSVTKSRVEVTKSKSREPYNAIDHEMEKSPDVTTYKPVPPSSTSKKEDNNLVNEESRIVEQVSDSDSVLLPEDEFTDSNTPRSVRFRGRDKPASTTSRATTESPDPEVPSTNFKSRRQFRRRRPDAAIRRRYFSSRVKPAIDLDEGKESSSPPGKFHQSGRLHRTEETPTTTADEKDDGFELPRASVLRHRRLFHRRRNLSHPQRGREAEGKSTSTTTAPSSTESESVTYGESQWFRIKPADSSEQPTYHHGNKQKNEQEQTALKAGTNKHQFKSKVQSRASGVDLVPLESTTELSGEEVSRSSFNSDKLANLKKDRKLSSGK